MSTEKDKETAAPLQVVELEGGGAEVFITEDKSERQEIRGEETTTTVTQADDDVDPAGDAALNTELEAAKDDAEREEIRARRRQERKDKKERSRALLARKDNEIAELRGRMNELLQWRGSVESRGFAADVARVEAGITQAQEAEKEAKAAMEEAVSTQNGAALAEAQELWYEAKRRGEALAGMKARLATAGNRDMDRAGVQHTTSRNVPDPEVKRHGSAWMGKHKWYDPNGGNQDSRVALAVDSQLAEDGYDPKTPEYWEALDERLKTYLPHRYAGYNGGADRSTERTERVEGQPQQRAGVTTAGSGRSAGPAGAKKFQLSADRVAAMKEAGIWDDAGKREKMIRQYRDFDLRNPKS